LGPRASWLSRLILATSHKASDAFFCMRCRMAFIAFAEMQARAPDFRAELADLKSTIERQQKTIVRLRGQASQLEFAQRQLDAEQSKNRREMTLTVTKLSAVGEQTRTALEALRENGFDLWEMEPPSGSS
jgi:septal ring factor EnvC (AmiA/AmiB activator)